MLSYRFSREATGRLVLNQALSGINLLAILALIMIKSARIGK